MSFRLFIYYCAMCGGLAAYLGWALGRAMSGENAVGRAGVQGMFLGLMVALGLGVVDALLNFAPTRVIQIGLRVVVAVVVGCFGGLIGGVIGQLLYGWLKSPVFVIFGWTITGLLIGGSIGVFDMVSALVVGSNIAGAQRKILNGTLGGTVGGLAGGALFLVFKGIWTGIFRGKPADLLWSPSATGFVALGLCIGLLIGLAQVILKEAWIRVESGFRAGRELILSKDEVIIGRSEASDIGLFGDAGVERTHAYIQRRGGRYLLVDAGTPSGTYLNGERIHGPTPLRSGDLIRVGKNTLRFGERQKRNPG
ncbi:MAG: FHA domain-containing protein [Planctomycetes bacterium]|nr:FHA domain-containing protein [Planctomycetota bacterium]